MVGREGGSEAGRGRAGRAGQGSLRRKGLWGGGGVTGAAARQLPVQSLQRCECSVLHGPASARSALAALLPLQNHSPPTPCRLTTRPLLPPCPPGPRRCNELQQTVVEVQGQLRLGKSDLGVSCHN